MYGGRDDLQERGAYNLDVSSVLVDILTDSFGRVHIITMTWRHLFHDLNQRLNQTPQITVTVNLRECAKQSSRGCVPTEQGTGIIYPLFNTSLQTRTSRELTSSGYLPVNEHFQQR